MSLYRRFARSKKGMATIFGGLFFIILILMGFNVMLWGFVQWDAYNHVIANMSQRDQQAASENVVPTNSTCDSNCKSLGIDPLTIWVNNLGGTSVNIVSVYISNVNGTSPCSPAPCILSPISGTGNIPAGSTNWPVKVLVNQGIGSNSYHIILATSRGRLFSLYYPWRFNSLSITNINNGNGNFVSNIGPLAIFFDFSSFNFTYCPTSGCQTTSQPAWILPTSTNIVLYVKVENVGSQVACLLPQTAILFQRYSTSGNAGVNIAYISDSSTINPSNIQPFVGQLCLPPPSPNGAASSTILKFGSGSQSGGGFLSFQQGTIPYILFIGFFYTYGGSQFPQGETVPFVAIRACNTYPVTTGC